MLGKLTALRNTAIALTVTNVFYGEDENGETSQEIVHSIEASYVVNGEIKFVVAKLDSLIGFGDYLTYADGAFFEAYDVEEDGEEGEDESTDA